MDIKYNKETGDVIITRQDTVKLEHLKRTKESLEKQISTFQGRLAEVNEIISKAK